MRNKKIKARQTRNRTYSVGDLSLFFMAGHFRDDREGKAKYMAELERLLYNSEDGESSKYFPPGYSGIPITYLSLV